MIAKSKLVTRQKLNPLQSDLTRTVSAAIKLFTLLSGLLLTTAGGSAWADFVNQNTCGGVDQKPCELSSARMVSKVFVPKPHPKAFPDYLYPHDGALLPGTGGGWWRCPDTHPGRTLLHTVDSNKACETDVTLISSGEKFRDPDGNIYSCPASHPDRTVHSVTGSQACSRTPPSGAFTDPNGKMYRCPAPHTSRTGSPVTGGSACERPLTGGEYAASGNIYQCPHGYTRDIARDGAGGHACGKIMSGGEYEAAGNIWHCPAGYRRDHARDGAGGNACVKNVSGGEYVARGNVYHCPHGYGRAVGRDGAGGNACSKGCGWGGLGTCYSAANNHGPHYRAANNHGGARTAANLHGTQFAGATDLGSAFARATKVGTVNSEAIFISKLKNPKPNGAFADARLDLDPNPLNLDNDEYWECPAGFWRNLNPVTDKEACTVNVGQNCDAGNIAVGNPWKGYSCARKGECGANGQRPCQIVERIPSCNSGLAEDFYDHVCVDESVAMCLTMTRATWLANEGTKGANKLMTELEKPLNLIVQEIIKTVPEDVRAKLEEGGDHVYKTTIQPIEAEVEKASNAIITELENAAGPLGPVWDLAKDGPDVPALVNIMTDSSICTDMAAGNTEQLRTRLQNALGVDLNQLGEIAMYDPVEKSWGERGLDFLIPSAVAHDDSFKTDRMKFYGIVGLNVQIVLGRTGGAGLSFDTYLVFDHHNIGYGFDIGGVLAFNAPIAQVTGFVGTKWSTDWQKMQSGFTADLAVQIPLPVGETLGDENGMKDFELGLGFRTDKTDYLSLNAGDEKFWASLLDSVVFGFSLETEDTTTTKFFKPIPKEDCEFSTSDYCQDIILGNKKPRKKTKQYKLGFAHLGGKGNDKAPEVTIGGGHEWIILNNDDNTPAAAITSALSNVFPNAAEATASSVTTGTTRLRASHTNLCLDNGGSSANGGNIFQTKCKGTDSQQLSIEPVPNKSGLFWLRFANDKCVHVQNASTANGGNITQWDCVEQDNLYFAMQQNVNGTYSFVSEVSDKLLTVHTDQAAEGANIAQHEYLNVAHQQWHLDDELPEDGRRGTLRVAHNSMCLDNGDATANEGNIFVANCDASDSQSVIFKPVPGRSGVYWLAFANNGKCVHLFGNSTANNADINQWDCVEADNLYFRLEQNPNGTYNVVSLVSDKLMSVNGWQSGGNVEQYENANVESQQWNLDTNI